MSRLRHAALIGLLFGALAVPALLTAQSRGKGTQYAFLVACSRYDKAEFRELPYTGNDVELFRRALLATGFAAADIAVLRDGTDHPNRFLPQKANILRELALVLEGLRPQDTVVVALSGHGLQFKGDPVSYFVPVDGKLADKKTLLPLSGPGGLYEQLKGCRAKKKLLLVNACRNDPAASLDFATTKVELADEDREGEVPEGIAAIYSCSAGQKSYYDPDRKVALFFEHAAKAWKGEYSGGMPLTLARFFEQVRAKTRSDAIKTIGRSQVPAVVREYQGEWVITAAKPPGTAPSNPLRAPVPDAGLDPKKATVLGQYQPDSQSPGLLVRQIGGKWHRLQGKNIDVVANSPLMVLPGMRGDVQLKTGVRLTLWGSEPEIWPNPLIYECRVELNANPNSDADLVHQRGRVVLRNTKADGQAATARVRFDNPTQKKVMTLDITLKSADAAVAIERLCSLPRNEPFYEDPANPNRVGPTADMYCFFLSGTGHIRAEDIAFAVDASQQPQLVTWGSTTGLVDPRPFPVDWALPAPKAGDPVRRKAALQAAQTLARNAETKQIDVALQEALEARDLPPRLLALRSYTAMDNFSVALEQLANDVVPDALRKAAIYSLRHWMRQERDNEYKLFEALRESYKKVVARKIMELLHGISATDAAEPATWQRLIDDLDNPVVALRELSAWNLEILVPAGQKIGYSASADQVRRRATQAQWRQLVPPGQLPAAPSAPPPMPPAKK